MSVGVRMRMCTGACTGSSRASHGCECTYRQAASPLQTDQIRHGNLEGELVPPIYHQLLCFDIGDGTSAPTHRLLPTALACLATEVGPLAGLLCLDELDGPCSAYYTSVCIDARCAQEAAAVAMSGRRVQAEADQAVAVGALVEAPAVAVGATAVAGALLAAHLRQDVCGQSRQSGICS